jgi:FlaA1/EpsC-like NDP-sugar epimerase
MTTERVRLAASTLTSRAGLTVRRDLVTCANVFARYASVLNYGVGNPVHVVIDAVLVAVSLYAAYLLRFDAQIPPPFGRQCLEVLPLAVSLSLAVFGLTGIYKQVWRYFAAQDASALAGAVTLTFLISVVWRIFDKGVFVGEVVPFGVLLIFPLFTFGAMVTVRVIRRVSYNYAGSTSQAKPSDSGGQRVLLAGAGEAGLYLLRELRERGFEVVGFVDDDRELQGRTIGGCSVLGTTHVLDRIVTEHPVDEVVLCMPSAPRAVLQRIASQCARMSVRTSTVPTLLEILSGQTRISQLRPVNMEDLLGRRSLAVPEDILGLNTTYGSQRILVTGAGGSIGSELVRQLSRLEPSQLLLLDKDENSLYEITCEIKEDFANVVPIVADIRNAAVLRKAFERYRPDVVFHAAAYKHVPLMEDYPAEAILTNVMGTRHVAELSEAFGVKTFVLVSTDKAVNPSSTMGASKRIAEMILQRLAAKGSATRFCGVRFGNVLGSRASVVPLFQRRIRQGLSITVTHPDVSRYFMTIPEAVQLVIQAGSAGEKGEIFVLDMGDPVKIVDLARNLIELSGLVPGRDVPIEFTGLRPGEKLTEELLIDGEQGVRSTRFSKIFVVAALERDWSQLTAAVNRIEEAAHQGAVATIHEVFHSLNIGYSNSRKLPAPEPPVVKHTVPADRPMVRLAVVPGKARA